MTYLLHVSIILFLTKIGGLISRKLNQPQVLGGLVIGLLIGPSMFGWIPDTEMIDQLAEIGVITLMFIAGLETDIFEFKKSLGGSLGIAMGGVVLPLVLGYATAVIFKVGNLANNIFIGVVLTATSVSITVRTLQEMGKLQSKTGYSILAAAIIDDVIGILLFSIILGIFTSTGNIFNTFIKIGAFLIFALLVGKLVGSTFNNYCVRVGQKQRIPIFAFALCLFLSYTSEQYFGVSAITGAYVVGISLSQSSERDYILNKMNILSYMFLMPIFFVSIGLRCNITMSLPWLFIAALSMVAIVGKIIGCGLPAMLCGYNALESLQVGIGMVSRGEVALIVATLGMEAGLLSGSIFSSLIIVVIISTIATPILLKLVYAERKRLGCSTDKQNLT